VDDGALEDAARPKDVDGGLLLELHRREDRHRRDEVGDHEDPARLPAAHLDEARQLQDAQRLAERRLRDSELLGERALVGEPVAGAQAGALDRLGEMLDRSLERPCRTDGLDLEARCGWHRGAVSQGSWERDAQGEEQPQRLFSVNPETCRMNAGRSTGSFSLHVRASISLCFAEETRRFGPT
jgi:hypothetical protein